LRENALKKTVSAFGDKGGDTAELRSARLAKSAAEGPGQASQFASSGFEFPLRPWRPLCENALKKTVSRKGRKGRKGNSNS
jgi:hypothetical protein